MKNFFRYLSKIAVLISTLAALLLILLLGSLLV